MATWEHSVILLQSDAKDQSIESLEYAIKHCNAISTDKTKIVHLSCNDLEAQDMPEVVEKKGKKGGKPQGATLAAMLQNWIKNDEIEGLKSKKIDMAAAAAVTSKNKNRNDNDNNSSKKTLKVDGPDIVYLLTDFPTSVDDADQLLKSEAATIGLLDGILQFVWRPGIHSSETSSSPSSPTSSNDEKNNGLGGMLPEIAAFNRLPHLEQAREAAAISRAAAAKKAQQSASAMLTAAMNDADNDHSTVDDESHSMLDDEEDKMDGFSVGKEVAGLEVRRKSFELPTPQHRAGRAPRGSTPAMGSVSSEPPLPSGANPLVDKLMEWSEKNALFPGWADLSFDEVLVNSSEKDAAGVLWPKPLEAMMSEFATKLVSRVTDRTVFRRWLRRVKHVSVPECKDKVQAAILAHNDADAQIISLDATRTTGRVGITPPPRRASSVGGASGGVGGTGGGSGGSGVSPIGVPGAGGQGNPSSSTAADGESTTSPWANNKMLATYATLCSEVVDNVFSAGVALHCMVEAVVLAEQLSEQAAILAANDPSPINTSTPNTPGGTSTPNTPVGTNAPNTPKGGDPGAGFENSITSSSMLSPSSVVSATTGSSSSSSSASTSSVAPTAVTNTISNAAYSSSSFTFGVQEEEEGDVLDGPMGPLGPGSVALDFGDEIGLRVVLAEVLVAENDQPELARSKLCSRMMVRLQRNMFEHLEFPRLRGAGALPLKPLLSTHERAVERSELLTFCRLSPRDINITRQVMMFEEMLNSRYTVDTVKNFHPWNFADRDTFEKLPKHVFKQVLSRAMASSPDVLKLYDSATDSLLVAVYHPTARHRCGEVAWHARDHVNARPPFPKWSSPDAQGMLTPRSLKASCGMIESKEDLASCSTITTKLFPADHALIVLTRHQSSPIAYLSCYKDDHVFGLRASPTAARPFIGSAAGSDDRIRPPDPSKPRRNINGTVYASCVAHFVCDFDDGCRLVVKEGCNHPQTATMSLSFTTTRGMVLTANSDGVMSMRYISTSKISIPKAAREEVSRSVGPGGVVTRWFRNGSVQIYRADGSTLVRPNGFPGFVVTNVNGTRVRAIPPMTSKRPLSRSSTRRAPSAAPTCTIEPLLEVPASIEFDPESGAKVCKVFGEDGINSTLIIYADQSKLARFDDGTTIKTSPNGQFVLVESNGFASVWLDKHVDKTASAHGRGEKVPVSHGGEKIRTRIGLSDGTRILTTYNTRITSEVRGKMILVRPDLTEVVVADSTQVESATVSYRPRGLWMGGEEKSQNLLIGDAEEQALKVAHQASQDVGVGVGSSNESVGDSSNGGDAKSDGCGIYEFNLFTGRLTTEDPEHNMFFASVNPEKADRNDKGATYDVDLAGKIQGDDTRAEAVVNDPMPPRLFVMTRDGNATELLKHQAIADFKHLCDHKALQVETEEPEALIGDEADIPGKQVVHHLILNPSPVSVFSVAFPYTVKLKWQQHQLPVCCRNSPDTFPKAPAHVIAPRISIRRVWQIIQQVSPEGRALLLEDLARWREFRLKRERSVNRFAVDDHRSKSAIEAEANIQKQLEKAMKEARMKRKLAEQKAREHEERLKALSAANAAAAAARKLDEESSGDEDDDDLLRAALDEDNSRGLIRKSSMQEPQGLPPGIGGIGHYASSRSARFSKDVDGDDEPLSPSSPYGDSNSETRNGSRQGARVGKHEIDLREDFYQECEAAYIFYTNPNPTEEDAETVFDEKGDESKEPITNEPKSNGYMKYEDVGRALVQVLNRAVSTDEVKHAIKDISIRTYKDVFKFSFNDFLMIATNCENENVLNSKTTTITSRNSSKVTLQDHENNEKGDDWNLYLTRKLSEQFGDFEGRLNSAEEESQKSQKSIENEHHQGNLNQSSQNDSQNSYVKNPEVGSYWSTAPAQRHISSQFKGNLSIDDIDILNNLEEPQPTTSTTPASHVTSSTIPVAGGGGLNAARANRSRSSLSSTSSNASRNSTQKRKNSVQKSSSSSIKSSSSSTSTIPDTNSLPPQPPISNENNQQKMKKKSVSKDILYKAMTTNLQTFQASPNVINFGRIELQDYYATSQSSIIATVELNNISDLAARFRLRTVAFTAPPPSSSSSSSMNNRKNGNDDDNVVIGNNGLKFNEMITSTSIPLKLSFKPRGPVPVNGNVQIKIEIIMSMLSEICNLHHNNNNNEEEGESKFQQDYDDPYDNGVKNLSYAMIVVAEHQEIVIPINMQVVVPLTTKYR